ncbi:fibrous sheath CABYR-binding protein [Oryzias latipes]|uniref:fibrous sheath CABYR-binding protein n=1 Tax=Oryzias latipes TaxID=8090 RepID=UPI0005CC19E8|nr:fibrous sheath CABYR-binding protein [Oryzias latipes]
MPSKRKKNKRRMRRVVQRRVLEEQHAANLPVKSSTGMVGAAPPAAAPKKAAKTAAPAPEKISPVIPITAPTKLEPKPVEKEPVVELLSENIHAPDADVGLVEQISAEAEDHLDVKPEAPTFAPETLPEEPSADETDAVHKAEVAVLETEPATEVAPPAEDPVGAPVDLEIQPEETAESEPTHPVFEPETEVKAESQPEEDSAASVEDVSAPVQEAAAEPVAQELHSNHVEPVADDLVSKPTVGSEAEAAAEISDQDVDLVAPNEQEEQEEHAAAIPAAPLSAAEDSLVEIEEIPVVSDKTSEAEEAEAPVNKNEKAADGLLTVESSAFQQETLMDGDSMPAQTQSVVRPDPDPAGEAPHDSAAEQTYASVLSDNPKAESCDLPCQMQLPVESVPLSAEEISVETALNGHIVPEVSIEG